MFKKILVPLVAAAAAGTFALGGAAHASVGGNVTALPITATNSQTIAGWYATANGANVFPTHLSATLGSDGKLSLENLAKSTIVASSTTTNGDIRVAGNSTILAGEGIGLINSDNGHGVEVGLVNIGNGLMDVVAGEGILNTQTPFGFAGLVGANDAWVLLANQPITESVDVDLQMVHGYSNGPVGNVIASARIAHWGNWHRETLGLDSGPVVLDEVQSGIINGSQPSVALNVTPSQIPLANTSRTGVPNELGRLAHLDVSANVRGGHEFHGAASTGGAPLVTSTAFTGFPVYTYTAVTAGEQIDLAPTAWNQDNFAVEGGLPLAG